MFILLPFRDSMKCWQAAVARLWVAPCQCRSKWYRRRSCLELLVDLKEELAWNFMKSMQKKKLTFPQVALDCLPLLPCFKSALASQWLFGRLAGRPPRKAEVCFFHRAEVTAGSCHSHGFNGFNVTPKPLQRLYCSSGKCMQLGHLPVPLILKFGQKDIARGV